MHGDAGSAGEAVDAVGDHLGAEVTNLLALETEVDNGKGTVRQIDDGAAEGLVERAVCESEASETGGGAEGLGEGVAESNADVFGGVVVVDCEGIKSIASSGWYGTLRREKKKVLLTVKITLASKSKRPASVLGEGVEHVIEETDAGVDANCLRLARLRGVAFSDSDVQALIRLGRECAAIKVEGDLNLGLVGVTRKGGPAGRRLFGAHFVWVGCLGLLGNCRIVGSDDGNVVNVGMKGRQL